MSMVRFARGVPVAGLLAASLASLPSLDRCPLAAWTAGTCETSVACGTAAAGCMPSAALPCDREPDPLPIGDSVWCIRPPVIAITARADDLPGPWPSTPGADLVGAVDVALPVSLECERFGPEPGPAALRAPHGPPQPRAPPIA